MTTTQVIMSNPWTSNNNNNEDTFLKDDPIDFSERVASVAQKELREDAATKEAGLQQFREWIKQNRDIENCRTDDKFLLRFLRVKKYSIPMAQQTLLKYLNLRKNFPHMCFNMDYLSPSMNELVTKGFTFASPVRDQNGRRVLFSIAKNFDPYKYNSADMAKAHILAYETLLEDEHSQVMGFTHVADCQTGGAAHITLWSPTEFATVMKWGEQSFPIRHKQVHILNLPTPFKYVFDFARTRISQKMRNRIQLHNNWTELATAVDPRVLPKEYGGSIPMADMIDMWKAELHAKRDRLMGLDDIKLLSDQGIICRKNKSYNNNGEQNGIVGLSGSFRRLEVD